MSLIKCLLVRVADPIMASLTSKPTLFLAERTAILMRASNVENPRKRITICISNWDSTTISVSLPGRVVMSLCCSKTERDASAFLTTGNSHAYTYFLSFCPKWRHELEHFDHEENLRES